MQRCTKNTVNQSIK